MKMNKRSQDENTREDLEEFAKGKKRQQTPQGSGCPRCSRQMASAMKKRQTDKMEAGTTQDVGTARHR
jgi:bacterioferritin-associated ferredoxin